MNSTISVLPQTVEMDQAIARVVALSELENLDCERSLYFPYYQFRGHATVPSLFNRTNVQLPCLVNAVTGHGATADEIGVDSIRVPAGDVIATKLTENSAARFATRTLTHTLTRKFRVLANFAVELDAQGVVYKKFWIVGDGRIRVMIDSVTGQQHPLKARAA